MSRPDFNKQFKKSLYTSKRPKSLKKLKWFCQMCEKQCSDELGFRRHCATEGHKNMMSMFAENPDHFINQFSEQFESDFLTLLKRRYGDNFVPANHFYQEYIKDRNHVHMNSTKWDTLQLFIEYLSDKNLVKVEETEKGTNIAHCANDFIKIQKKKREKTTTKNIVIPKPILQAEEKPIPEMRAPVIKEFKKEDDSKISFKFKQQIPHTHINPLELTTDTETALLTRHVESHENPEPIKEIVTAILYRKLSEAQSNPDDCWIITGIIVKVVSDKLGADFLYKKGAIIEVENKYLATVKMIDTGNIAKFDQIHLQTVIPAIGREIVVLIGHYRGCKGRIMSVDKSKSTLNAQLYSEPFHGKILENLSFDDVSKLAS